MSDFKLEVGTGAVVVEDVGGEVWLTVASSDVGEVVLTREEAAAVAAALLR